jgi:hypothetical protein
MNLGSHNALQVCLLSYCVEGFIIPFDNYIYRGWASNSVTGT